MKKLISLLIILFAVVVICLAYLALKPATQFETDKAYFIIYPGKTKPEQVVETLKEQNIIQNARNFRIMGNVLNIWEKVVPGKYEVKKNDNLLTLARMLKNKRQMQIKLVINKIRTKEDFAKLISKNFAVDSSDVINFINHPDSLKPFQSDSTNFQTLIQPNTYFFYYFTSIENIFKKLSTANEQFWQSKNRLQKAAALGLTPKQVYILASIVEEETNKDADKPYIASVYLNRLRKNMRLEACPTIKFAMKDFSISRIYEKYLNTPSPYNTYKNRGLPPGPICTPSAATIDAVLNAPSTEFIFFVAKADFSGYHHFSASYKEHQQYAKAYQKALDEWMAKKQNQNIIEKN